MQEEMNKSARRLSYRRTIRSFRSFRLIIPSISNEIMTSLGWILLLAK
jgi:hypothetical protein